MIYQPSFIITSRITRLLTETSELLGRASVQHEQSLQLRRVNRIRTIHGSLAIEGNTLTEEQITAILDGKRVLAPLREILEVQNAMVAYDALNTLLPHREKDLLVAHGLLMKVLITDAGRYRNGGVGVMAGDKVIHMAPPANKVPTLMKQLLVWLKQTDMHPLLASSIFHYEFEFIHPFSDGNGRIGRLWQSLILAKWNPLFAHIPVESLVHQHQQAYYKAINASTAKSDAAPFVEFMLSIIRESLSETLSPQVTPQASPQVIALLRKLKQPKSRDELQLALGLADRKSFRLRYLLPALEAGLIEMTLPDKPNSPLQKYRLSVLGMQLI